MSRDEGHAVKKKPPMISFLFLRIARHARESLISMTMNSCLIRKAYQNSRADEARADIESRNAIFVNIVI